MRHRKEDSDRAAGDENWAFSNVQKRPAEEETSKGDDGNYCHIRDLRSLSSESRDQEDKYPNRLADHKGIVRETPESAWDSDEHEREKADEEFVASGHQFFMYSKEDGTNSHGLNQHNLTSHSNVHESLGGLHASIKAKGACANDAKNHHHPVGCKEEDVESGDSGDMLGFAVPPSLTNQTEESVATRDRLFMDEQQYNQKLSKREAIPSYQPGCRKSPIHGEAPRNSALHESEGPQSMEGLAVETWQTTISEIKYPKQHEISSMEPSNTENFLKIISLDASLGDAKDCSKIVTRGSSASSGNKTQESPIGEAVGQVSSAKDEETESIVSKKSEDSRKLTCKRSQAKNNGLCDLGWRSCKSHKRRSAEPSCKAKAEKTRCDKRPSWSVSRSGKNRGLVEKSSCRLTRSQKKESHVSTSVVVGVADDDSGIQGDIYEFSEKEDSSLPGRVPHSGESKASDAGPDPHFPSRPKTWYNASEAAPKEDTESSDSRQLRETCVVSGNTNSGPDE